MILGPSVGCVSSASDKYKKNGVGGNMPLWKQKLGAVYSLIFLALGVTVYTIDHDLRSMWLACALAAPAYGYTGFHLFDLLGKAKV